MKINVKRDVQGYLFKDIEAGEVFYHESNPDVFYLRTDADGWVAVDIKTGELYHAEYFVLDGRQYRVVKSEVTIS